ncbi:hypothetical protein OUZ56_003252 [Daphnia magna]|uniref:Uncharacterized protein n=1 Tax=Daphnia magna TaxID=35525 RepID=A0ABR0A872_9CRUS|nr:hypothetical protein OUZ56_003252 [Daphnia magna]
MIHQLMKRRCDRGNESLQTISARINNEFPGFPRGLQTLFRLWKRKNPWLPSCPRDPSRRLHPRRELSSVSVETSPTPDSSLESGTLVVNHLVEEADSQGESVETARDSDSDPETEVVLRAESTVVPVSGQQFVVPSGHIAQS